MMRPTLIALLMLGFAAPAAADNLVITKTATIVADPLGYTLTPRSLPGAVVDYKVVYQNPSANLFKPVKNVVTEDWLPANVALRVSDLAAAGKGPIEFLDGSLLGTGLLGSGLTYSFAGLGNAGDGIEFSNGASWAYVPQPDAEGYDANVRAIRVTTGSATAVFAAGTQFQLRYRVKIR